MVVTISFGGYIKRVPLSTYRAQLRGGKGRSGMTMKEEDYVQDIIVANTHDRLLFFTNIGQVYRIPVYQLPVGTPQAKGRAIINVLPIEKDEKITSILDVSKDMDDKSTLLFVTSKGQVRRNAVSDFERIQSNGKRAMVLEDGETLIEVKTCRDDNTILLNTKKGLFIRFDATDVRIFSGRTSTGVRGIKLAHDDSIISASVLEGFNVDPTERALYLRARAAEHGIQPDDQDAPTEGALSEERRVELQAHEQYILTITDLGFGKRTSGYEYRTTGRGGQGANGILLSAKNGYVANAFPVTPQDQIMLITNKGRLLRCGVNDIRIAGRRTQGVIIMRLEKDERVVNVTKIEEDSADE
jgi:DNA gyrase subunit A